MTASDKKLYQIYKISSPDTDMVYIGSTTNKNLKYRLSEHKRAFKRYKAGKFGNTAVFRIFENVDLNTIQIACVDAVITDDRDYALTLENSYIKITENTVNKRTAIRTREEKLEYHREYGREYNKKNVSGITVECDICHEQKSKHNISTHKKSCILKNNK